MIWTLEKSVKAVARTHTKSSRLGDQNRWYYPLFPYQPCTFILVYSGLLRQHDLRFYRTRGHVHAVVKGGGAVFKVKGVRDESFNVELATAH